jgi:sugar transport protein
MAMTAGDKAVMDRAVTYLVNAYSPNGRRLGWLMLVSILIEAWDLYAIGYVLIFLREAFHPSAAILGLAAAGTQGGAILGALLGGWLTDRIGRRAVFLSTMLMFIVFALAQAFVPGIGWLVVVRLILGIPLGSDISNGYTYIMEVLPKGEREVVGNRWQFMFALGGILGPATVAVLLLLHLPHDLVWRLTLGLGALPAAIIFVLRFHLPETAIWLVRQGRFREAKRVTTQMYGDPIAFLPDQDIFVEKPRPAAFLADIARDPVRLRATLFGWIAGSAQGSEFSTFGFYLPVLFVLVGVSGVLGTNLVLMGLSGISAVAGWIGPLVTPRIGQRGLSISGFSVVFASLLVAAFALYSNNLILLPLAAATMYWGHSWDSQNCVTIPAMVARPEYRGTATGFAYMFVKLPSFLAIFLFPILFAAIGKVNSTLFVAVFPLIGLLAAIFILPEVYGYGEDASARPGTAARP